MYRLFIKLITYLIITSFLTQNIAWAGGDDCLAPDSKLDDVVREIGPFIDKQTPRRTFRDTKFPAGINQKKLDEFWRMYGNFGVIEGIIGAGRKFVFSGKASKEVRRLIKRLNNLLSKLAHFPSDTVVRLSSTAVHPILYHKDDKILEIHAILLDSLVDNKTLEFAARHDERHCVLEGIDAWEELLNTYMDIFYLQELGNKADKIINTLRTLEGENGYWRLLVRRNELFGDEAQQKEYLKDVIRFIYPRGDVTSESLERDINERAGVLITLWRLAGEEAVHTPMQYLTTMAKVMLEDITLSKRWLKMEEELLERVKEAADPVDITPFGDWGSIITDRLWKNGRIEAVLYGRERRCYLSKETANARFEEGRLVLGYDEKNGMVVLIPVGLQNKTWASGYIKEGFSGVIWGTLLDAYKNNNGSDRDIKILQEVYNSIKQKLDPQALVTNIDVALKMVDFDVDLLNICAALVQGMDVNKLQGIFSLRDLQRLKYLLEQSRKIQNLPYLPLKGTRYSIQNYLNLLIQLSTDPDGKPNHSILLLVILNKLARLQELSEQEVLWIYAPLCEFLGLEDLAVRFRDSWFKMTSPREYERIKQEIVEAIGGRHSRYSDLERSLERLRQRLEKELSHLGISGIKVYARVKSPYSVREKIRAKTEEYPDVRSIQDLLGIHVVFPNTELYKVNKTEIDAILREIFPVTDMHSHKRAGQYGFEEYDFVGLTGDLLKVEVQAYPSEKDYRLYKTGLRAHWIYKLKRQCPDQEFDIELIEKTQNRLIGDFKEDFYTIYNSLSQWVFAGVRVKDRRDKGREKLHIARLPRGSIDADLASSRRVNALDKGFLGIKEVSGSRLVRQVKPGVYTIEKGPFAENRFRAIKKKTDRLRTYLTVSKILDKSLSKEDESRGKELLDSAFGYLKTKMDNKLLLSIVSGLGLESLDEFYSLIYIISQPIEESWFEKVYKQLVFQLTNEKVSEEITDVEVQRILKRNGLVVPKKMNSRILLLAYIMTASLRGRDILKNRGIKYRDSRIERRLELLLPEYGLKNLEQLYSRLGMYPDFIYSVLVRYSMIDLPVIRFRLREDIPGIYDKVFRIMQREDVVFNNPVEEGGYVSILFYPPKAFVISTIDRILDDVGDIPGVERESVEYVSTGSHELIKRKVVIITRKDNENTLRSLIAGLMAELKISFQLGAGRSQRRNILKQEFILEIPRDVPLDILEEAIKNRLESRGIEKFELVIEGETTQTRGILLPLNIPLELLVGLLSVYLLWCLGKFVWNILKDRRLSRRIGELFSIWQILDREPVRETPLLTPFYEEVGDIPSGGEFEEIVRGLEIRRVERVITKVSDMAYYNLQRGIDLRYETQGYKVLGLYRGRLYRLLIVGENCKGIGYHPGAKDVDTYFSLGKEITRDCGPVIMDKIREYAAGIGGRLPPVRRMIVIPMEGRQEFERFSRDSIFCRSIMERFPVTRHSLPSFTHDRYMLKMDNPEMVAYYIQKDGVERGIMGRSMFRLSTGTDALHESVHAIYDYDAGLQARVVEHFTRNPNTRLEEEIAEGYGYDLGDDKEHIVNEEFAYTLSEFAAMTRPWFSVDEMSGLRKKLDLKTIEEIRDVFLNKLKVAKSIYGEMHEEVSAVRVEIGRIWNGYRQESISETEARQKCFELNTRLMNLILLPPVRLVDVSFFARNGLIEPWMDPLELGYSKEDLKGDVDTEYYLRVIEFLIEISRTDEAYYRLSSTLRWVPAPFGDNALIDARRLTWALIKTNYGINSLDELKDNKYELSRFYTAPSVLHIAQRIAEAELGVSRFKKPKKKENRILGRFNAQIGSLEFSSEDMVGQLRLSSDNPAVTGMKYLASENPWVTQAFFEKIVFESPKILLVDMDVVKGLNEKAKRDLIRLINQVKGRVVVFSSTQRESGGVIDFLRNYKSIYIGSDESEGEFVQRLYTNIQAEYKVMPEDITVFTGKDSFVRSWRRIARESLFYILDSDNLYVTNEDLLAIQVLLGETRFDTQPGESIELLPKYYYTPEALEELGRREAEQGA